MDWQEFLFHPEHNWLTRFDKMARKRFSKTEFAEDAVNQIIKQFSADNWSALGDINQQKSPAAYLSTLFRNRLEDIARKRFGRPRAPKWLKDLGGIWMTVYKRLCLERQTPKSIVFAFEEQSDSELIDSMITTIKTKHPKCGTADCQEISLESHQEQHQAFEPVDETTNNNQEQLLLALSMFCGLSEEDAMALKSSASFFKDLDLSAEQQLVLKLIYQQGLKISQVSRMLNTPDHKIRKLHQETLNLLKNSLVVRQGEV